MSQYSISVPAGSYVDKAPENTLVVIQNVGSAAARVFFGADAEGVGFLLETGNALKAECDSFRVQSLGGEVTVTVLEVDNVSAD